MKELRERLFPLDRAVSFGNCYVPRRKEIKEAVSKREILQLILQFLDNEGLKESRQKLEKLAKMKCKKKMNLERFKLLIFF